MTNIYEGFDLDNLTRKDRERIFYGWCRDNDYIVTKYLQDKYTETAVKEYVKFCIKVLKADPKEVEKNQRKMQFLWYN